MHMSHRSYEYCIALICVLRYQLFQKQPILLLTNLFDILDPTNRSQQQLRIALSQSSWPKNLLACLFRVCHWSQLIWPSQVCWVILFCQLRTILDAVHLLMCVLQASKVEPLLLPLIKSRISANTHKQLLFVSWLDALQFSTVTHRFVWSS